MLQLSGSLRNDVFDMSTNNKTKDMQADGLASSRATWAKRIMAERSSQTIAVSASVGALALGTGGAVAGVATGSILGAVAGFIPAFFTFGLSIPVGAILGGGTGLVMGATGGGAVGAVSGGAVGYRLCRTWRTADQLEVIEPESPPPTPVSETTDSLMALKLSGCPAAYRVFEAGFFVYIEDINGKPCFSCAFQLGGGEPVEYSIWWVPERSIFMMGRSTSVGGAAGFAYVPSEVDEMVPTQGKMCWVLFNAQENDWIAEPQMRCVMQRVD